MGHNFGQKDALLVGVVETRPCGRLFNDSESNTVLPLIIPAGNTKFLTFFPAGIIRGRELLEGGNY